MPSISFLFPCFSKVPVGGYKIILEQAKRLQQDGWDVHLVYPKDTFLYKVKLRRRIKSIIWYLIAKINPAIFSSNNWFSIKNVNEHFVFSLQQKNMPKTDYYCATAVETAIYLNQFKNIHSDNKLYYIQDFENWVVPEDILISSYKYKMKKIVISEVLKKRLDAINEKSYFIPNGLDQEYFELTNPITNRNSKIIALLNHHDNRKRVKDALLAINIVKNEVSDLRVLMFGTIAKDTTIPYWIEYYQLPSKEKHNWIYNTAAIFVAASEYEGWGLPPAEAMLCGCALCCTNFGGFLSTEENIALVSDVYDVQTLADNIMKLILDDSLRIKIANQGNAFIKQFTWDKTYTAFKNVLSDES